MKNKNSETPFFWPLFTPLVEVITAIETHWNRVAKHASASSEIPSGRDPEQALESLQSRMRSLSAPGKLSQVTEDTCISWNPNDDPCFGWKTKALFWRTINSQNRGLLQVPGIYYKYYIYIPRCSMYGLFCTCIRWTKWPRWNIRGNGGW